MPPRKRTASQVEPTTSSSPQKRARRGAVSVPAPTAASSRPRRLATGTQDQTTRAMRTRAPKIADESTKQTARQLPKSTTTTTSKGRPTAARSTRESKKAVTVPSKGRPGRRGKTIKKDVEEDAGVEIASRTGKRSTSKRPTNNDVEDSNFTVIIKKDDNRPKRAKQLADEEIADESGHCFWLMKAEPESRLEKGIDVRFSIDDLAAATEPEPWDGVRNYVARNNLRAMAEGDKAFFYHSNCKVPGIAGILEIVRENSVDASALDPKHPYYDPKATPENPRWSVVHVEFRRKFKQLISLTELKTFARPGGILEDMELLRQSRLSVSKVTKKQWDFIMKLANDAGEVEENEGRNEDAETVTKPAPDNKENVNGEESEPHGATSAEEPPIEESEPHGATSAEEPPINNQTEQLQKPSEETSLTPNELEAKVEAKATEQKPDQPILPSQDFAAAAQLQQNGGTLSTNGIDHKTEGATVHNDSKDTVNPSINTDNHAPGLDAAQPPRDTPQQQQQTVNGNSPDVLPVLSGYGPPELDVAAPPPDLDPDEYGL
ncbi:DUF55-domain-containing protein [Xylona heveae TC161]|uniref:Thymocyte nuclear protein 1 n=1 Tax=Xylona heveae (strain CBS 132557 / TC161) TaxID=1328760 RepID=A0A165JGJ6_XYLHT|nr:DUF55-domain-containing protein [Xylona heveae TC161]KZF26208.1 DUF55-domain-containing protein [Xylona heveae TC161]